MAWMGARSNVAAITALDVTDLQDNITFISFNKIDLDNIHVEVVVEESL